MKQVFPFIAISGQEKIKNALIWNVINPKIGGVLISGEKGTAKSTLVRGLSNLLDEKTVIDLPLNITEDRLIGSIDIKSTVQYGVKKIEYGLLKDAHNNILYIDEVNLLSDHIIHYLLSVTSSNINIVEREGISLSHPSKFILVGTMNPEEGKIRAQFLDKFGLYVEVEGIRDIFERSEITKQRISFEKDTKVFLERYSEEEKDLNRRIKDAIKSLDKVKVTENAIKLASTLSRDAYSEGHRAEIIIIETAKAIAIFDGRYMLTADDIKIAAKYVLPHRMREKPSEDKNQIEEDQENKEEDMDQENMENEEKQESEESQENEGDMDQENDNPIESQENNESRQDNEDDLKDESTEEESNQEEESNSKEDIDDLDDEEIQDIGAAFNVNDWIQQEKVKKSNFGAGKRNIVKTSTNQGRYIRAIKPKNKIGGIALDSTIRTAALHQKYRDKRGKAIAIEMDDVRVKVREKRTGNSILFIVDASGSMGARNRMEAVKGAICSLLNDAYQKRDKVGMVAFRKNEAEVLLNITRSVDLAKKQLEILPTGGRTPLAQGIKTSLELIRAERFKDEDTLPILVLVSDGRANASINGGNAMEEAMKEASKVKLQGYKSIMIDTENDFIQMNFAKDIAKLMGATYYKIENLKSDQLIGIISQSM